MLPRPTFRGLSHELSLAPKPATPAPSLETAPAPPPATILEANQRLSRSLLWQLERNYFSQQGIQAWNTGAVPHYVTSNPTIARAYANVILAYLRDHAYHGTLDLDAPLYILELGSGSGRFAFHFLNYLVPRLDSLDFPHPSVTYLMTDLAQANLDYWRNHSRLQSFLEIGHLDFALLDAIRIQAIALTQSEQTLTAKTLKNPLAVIANYFFDCLPQDAFIIQDGILYESLVTLSTPHPDPDLADPDLINHLDLSYTYNETDAEYYDNPHFNTLLAHYQHTLHDTCLLLPHVALQCIDQIHHLAKGRFLFLTADKGYSHETDLHFRHLPTLARHGNAFSLMVNYHAISQYTQRQGGEFLIADHRHTSINICGLLFSDSPSSFSHTHREFTERIIQGGPDDFFALKKAIDPHLPDFTLPQILAYLRLSHWDANIFWGCFPAIMTQLETESERLWPDLRAAIHQVWDSYYPIGEHRDLAFYCGMVLFSIQSYADAIEYFQHSRQHYGDDASTLYNMGMCYYKLSEFETALDYLEQAATLDKTFTSYVAGLKASMNVDKPIGGNISGADK